MDYVQVPIEKVEKQKVEIVEITSEVVAKEKKKADLVKQMSLSTADGTGMLVKSGSESSISEACDSVKETSKRFEAEKDECSDNEIIDKTKTKNDENDKLSTEDEGNAKINRKPSLVSAKSLHELKEDDESRFNRKQIRCNSTNESQAEVVSATVASTVAATSGKPEEEDANSKSTRGIRPSKSDTSLTDSFVVIDNDYKKRTLQNQNMLRDGMFIFFFR